jgi:hypothetical protein
MLTIKAEAMPGDRIEVTATDMVDLANRTACWVHVSFNGVDCYAAPDGDAAQLVREFRETLGRRETGDRRQSMAFAGRARRG